MYKFVSIALSIITAGVLISFVKNEPATDQQLARVPEYNTINITIEVPAPQQFPIDYNELECLAKNIYFESRGESIDGQVAVSQVVLNRVESKNFPNTICGVVYQGQLSNWYLEEKGLEVPVRNRCQFSWWCDGRSDTPRDMNAWGQALTVAAGVMRNEYPDIVEGAMWYHATYVSPHWRNDMFHVASIGNHVFYTAAYN